MKRAGFINLYLYPIMSLVLLVGLLAGCGGSTGAAEEAAAGAMGGASKSKDDVNGETEEAVSVEVAQLDRGPIESVLRASASLEAESHVQVFSQASRLVRELFVEEGDLVRRDQVLLRLEDEAQRNALSKVKIELDKARREHEREKRLYEQQLISEQAFNDAVHDLETLALAVADAERELGYTEVRAPIAGTVTARLVKLGDQITSGQHLFDIVDFDSIVARVYVPEKNLPVLRAGQTARIVAQALDGRQYRGVVKRIAPVVDAQSGTVKVTVAVGRQPGLLPGMYVDVDLVTATHDDAVLIPKRALVYDDDQIFVYRLAGENRVERVSVDPVLADRDHVEPRAGLTEGDEIVIAGQAGLKDGARVELLTEGDGEEPVAEEIPQTAG